LARTKTKFAHFKVFTLPRDRAIKALNDTYVLTSLTEKSLHALQRWMSRHEDEPEQNYEVPSSNGETVVLSRDRGHIFQLLENAYVFGIHEQALIAAVALTEDYLQTTLKTILHWFPEKLKKSIAGHPRPN
jgi:hypothetical protein